MIGAGVGLGSQFQAIVASGGGASGDPDATVTVAEGPVDGFVYGLNTARTSASVPISGTFTGTPGTILARVVTDLGDQVVGWVAIDAAPTGGTFSGSITVPEQGLQQLRAEVQAVGATQGAVAQVGLWSVGLVVLAYGQSNSIGWSTAGSQAGNASIGMNLQYNAVDTALSFGWQDAGSIKFIEEMNALVGLPVFVIAGGKGGVGITSLMAGTQYMDEMLAAVNSHANGYVHAILWNQGEGDATTTNPSSEYPPHLAALHATMATETGQTVNDVPLVLSPLMTTARNDEFITQGTWADFKDMQLGMATNAITPNVFVSASVDDMVRDSVFHAYDGSHELRGAREAYALAKAFGDVAGDYDFRISEVVATDNTTTTLTLSHGLGTDFTIVSVDHEPVDPSAPYQVPQVIGQGGVIHNVEVTVDDWVTPVLATGVRTDANTITLTHAAVGGGVRAVRYLFDRQMDDLAGIAVDNSPYAVPLRWETSKAIVDIIAPSLAGSSPADGAVDMVEDGDIVLTFTEDVVAGTGTFTLWNITDTVVEEVFTSATGSGNNGGTVSISGTDVTLAPGANMTVGGDYAILWDERAVEDASGNPLAANASQTYLTFTVADAALNVFLLDPDFDDTNLWIKGTGWDVVGGEAVGVPTSNYANVTSSGSPLYEPFADTMAGSAQYIVEIEVSEVTGAGGKIRAGVVQLNASNATLATGFSVNEVIATPGIYTGSAITTHADTTHFRVKIDCHNQGANLGHKITSVKVHPA